jgi:hypothetical protein
MRASDLFLREVKMKPAAKTSLPEGFKRIEQPSVSFDDGDQVLEYCLSCLKKPKCIMNQTLSNAMGDNFPYWSRSFVHVEISIPHTLYDDSITRVYCSSYKSPQLRLPRVPAPFSDGVELLIEFAEREKAGFMETHGNDD